MDRDDREFDKYNNGNSSDDSNQQRQSMVDLFLGLRSSKTARTSSISREGTSTMVQDRVSTWLLSQLEEIADLRLV